MEKGDAGGFIDIARRMIAPKELFYGNLKSDTHVFRGVGDSEATFSQHMVYSISTIQYHAGTEQMFHDDVTSRGGALPLIAASWNRPFAAKSIN